MPLLPEFRKLTEMVPELHFLPPNELLAGLVSDRFDLVVAGMPDAVLPAAVRAHEGIVRVPWQPIDWALVAQPTVVARRLPARPRNATTVFFPDYAFPRRTQLEAACRQYFPDLHLAKLETAEAVKSAVSNGLGAGVLVPTPVGVNRTRPACRPRLSRRPHTRGVTSLVRPDDLRTHPTSPPPPGHQHPLGHQ